MNSLDGDLSSFLGEAEDLVAGLYDTLAGLTPDSPPRQPEINALFRATHTLKGLAGMLDFDTLQAVSHKMEDLLGEVRLGRIPWSPHLAEVVAVGVDHIREIVNAIAAGRGDASDVSAYLNSVEAAAAARDTVRRIPKVDLPADILASFTEYEESRLAAAVEADQQLLELTFVIKLSEFAEVGQQISEALDASGEVITKLPAPGASGGELTFVYIFATPDESLAGSLPELFGDRLHQLRVLESGWEEGPGLATPPPTPAPAPAPAPVEESATPADAARTTASVRIELETLDQLTAAVGGLLVEKASLEDVARELRNQIGDATPYPQLLRAIRGLEKRANDLQRGPDDGPAGSDRPGLEPPPPDRAGVSAHHRQEDQPDPGGRRDQARQADHGAVGGSAHPHRAQRESTTGSRAPPSAKSSASPCRERSAFGPDPEAHRSW